MNFKKYLILNTFFIFSLIKTTLIYAVSPTVTSIYPAQGEIDGYITLIGTNFDDVDQWYYVDLNNQASQTSWYDRSATQLVLQLNSDMRNGNLTLTGNFGVYVTPMPFTLATPTFTSIFPTTGTAPDGKITITGTNLRAFDRVLYASNSGSVSSFAIVPQGTYLTLNYTPASASTGPLTFVGGFGTVVSGIVYTPAQPTVTGIFPTVGAIDEYLTLSGTNLSSVERIFFSNLEVSFNYISSNGSLIVNVPGYANTGPLTLTGGFGTYVTSFSYQIPTPSITGISAFDAQGSFTIFGSNLNSITYVRFPTENGNYFSLTKQGSSSSFGIFDNSAHLFGSGLLTILGVNNDVIPTNIATPAMPLPTVTGLDPIAGAPSGFITLSGSALYGINEVLFKGIGFSGVRSTNNITRFHNYIVVGMPNNVIDGFISVSGLAFGTVPTQYNYINATLTPTITGFNPTYGLDASDDLRLIGSGLAAINSVSFVSSLTGVYQTFSVLFDSGELFVYNIPADVIDGFVTVSGTGFSNIVSQVSFYRTAPVINTTSGAAFSSTGIVFSSIEVLSFVGTSANLAWPTLLGATTYCIRFSKTLDFSSTVQTICGLTSANHLFVLSTAGLRMEGTNETIFYQVAGVNANGNMSQWSAVQSFVLEIGETTSLNEVSESLSFDIFPNPSSGSFTLKNTPIGSKVEIYNMMGILITSQAISKEEYLMDLELSKGIYQVKIGSLTKKLVIE